MGIPGNKPIALLYIRFFNSVAQGLDLRKYPAINSGLHTKKQLNGEKARSHCFGQDLLGQRLNSIRDPRFSIRNHVRNAFLSVYFPSDSLLLVVHHELGDGSDGAHGEARPEDGAGAAKPCLCQRFHFQRLHTKGPVKLDAGGHDTMHTAYNQWSRSQRSPPTPRQPYLG